MEQIDDLEFTKLVEVIIDPASTDDYVLMRLQMYTGPFDIDWPSSDIWTFDEAFAHRKKLFANAELPDSLLYVARRWKFES